MCICIIAQQGARPSTETLEKCASVNDDGAGVAWIEQHQGEDKVWWEKGLTADEVIDLHTELPHPYILHFRKQSAGSATDNLAHPFPIGPVANDDLSGKADRVLFHNGTVGDWKDYYRSFVASRDVSQIIPYGFERMSDTRAMAYMVHHHMQHLDDDLSDEKKILQAENALKVYDNRSRFCILDATTDDDEESRSKVRYLGDWLYASEIDGEDDATAFPVESTSGNVWLEGGLLFSNTSWKRQKTTTT